MSTDELDKNSGCLYGVGVGPGDPELLTLKASRVLQRVGVVCVRQPESGSENFTLDVVREFLNESTQDIVRLPLPSEDTPGSATTWDAAFKNILSWLGEGRDVAFITEGDPMLYSSFSYLLDRVRAANPEALVEVIPGVSSVMAAAASAGVPLATHGQRLAILPAVYGIDDLRQAIASYDTVVLMEVNRTLPDALANLEKLGLAGRAIYVRRATTQREEVVQNIHQLSEEDFDYFSLLIIKR